MQFEITVREIVQTNILSCSPQTPLAEAAQQMVAAHCGSILVEAAGHVVGIWTEQDAVALDFSEPAHCGFPIAQAMSSPVKTIDIDATIGHAALRFREEGVRHFLVIDGAGKPRGVLSQSDIVIHQGIEYFVSLREVASVFQRRHKVVPAAMPVREAIAEMRGERLDAIIVRAADGGHGIVTERDVLRLIGLGSTRITIGELASFPLITLPLNASLYNARKLFIEQRIRHLGVTDADGELLGLITFADILANIEYEYVRHLREALRESEANLAASNRRLRLAAKAFESTFEGILVTNGERIIESVNPAFTLITGYAAEEVIGKTPAVLASGRHDVAFYRAMDDALAQTGHWQGEICNRRRNGEIYVEWLTINAIKDSDGRVTNYVAVFTDFTTRKAAEEQIRFLAHHDALTGLLNRAVLRERLVRAIPHARRNGRKLAVIFIDLDDFKGINDRFGHDAGDRMLRTVAQRLTASVRAEDTVARLGGDEFVLVLEELDDAGSVVGIVAKLIQTIAEPIPFDRGEMKALASVGVSIFPDDGGDPDELLRNADLAMYKAKEQGHNRFHFFAGTVA